LKNYLQKSAQEAVLAVAGVTKVNINLTANVSGQRAQADDKIVLPIKNSIAVSSGKGGVGKTTVAVNLAVSLAQSGAKVGLLDADIYGPNVPTMMGIDTLPPVKDKKITPAEAYGVKVISIGFLVKEGQPLIWRGPLLHSTIRQFLVDVNWGDLDYLVIDLPPGTGDVQLSVAQNLTLTGGLVVTLPQKVSIEDAARGLEMFNKLNVPILGVIENMSYLELEDGTRMDIFGSGGGRALAERAGVPFLGEIPLTPAVREGGDNGKPIVIADPDSAAAKALDEITCSVAGKISQLVMQD
jgi:ATP-binding protein involved in chromosome partitioning